MAGHARFPILARLALAITVVAVALGGLASPREATAASLPRWTGGIDLYRAGVFTTQKTWLWCTAADVQIIRNIVQGKADHTRSSQQRYFDYMRAHNRYDIPVKDGVDPAGWTAGLRRFVDSRYRLTVSRSFDTALRSAVTNLRKTSLPVAITVSHGNHAWVLTGFTATADPAVTTRFSVTSVRVTGPLWGLQSRTYGYDMRPDRKLTPSQLRTFFTPWHYAGVKMAWEGRWVSVQPIPAKAAAPTATATPRPTATPAPTASPTPAQTAPTSPTAQTSPTASAGGLEPGLTPAASPGGVARVADPAPDAGPGAGLGRSVAPTAAADEGTGRLLTAVVWLGAAALLVIGALALRARRRRAGRSGGPPPR